MLAVGVGLLIGLILGLTGAGGSVMALPLLIHLLGIEAHVATGISLGAVSASAWFGVLTRLQKHEIVWLPGIVFALTGALFAPVGLYVARFFSASVIVGGFSVLMVYIGIRMLRQSRVSPEQTRHIRARRQSEGLPARILFDQVNGHYQPNFRRILTVCLGGVATGLMSGFFGVGGGFIIIPILVLITGIVMKQAVGTSLFVVACISSAGFVAYAGMNPDLDWVNLLKVAFGGVCGMLLGTLVGQRLAGPTLSQIFAVAVFVLAGVNIYSLLA